MSAANPKLSKARALELLEQARMDVAHILAGTYQTQAQCHAVIGITGGLWEAITGEEAPDIEVTPRVVRSA